MVPLCPMAEDGLPNIYSPPPKENSKTEATIFFGADNTISRTETSFTSEGDHITSVNDYRPESDFSTTTGNKLPSPKERIKSEDDVEPHVIKPTIHLEKEITALTGTANTMANDSFIGNLIPVKIGNNSSLVATVSLIDFSTNTAEKDIPLDNTDPGDNNVLITSEVSSESTIRITDSPVLPAKKNGPAVDNCSSSVKSSITDNAAIQIIDYSTPEAEKSLTTEKNITIPDITNLTEQKITEIDLILPEDDTNAEPQLMESDEEKLITVFELTTTAEKDKDNSEDMLTNEDSVDGVNVWMEKETANEAENQPILLTAVESRYDFVVPASVGMNVMEDSSTTKDLSENNRTEPEAFSGTSPIFDTPNHKEDTFTTEMGVFKLLKEDPDEFLI
ncbi:calcium-binding and spermatid-specific protein 1 isoform X1 [Talpa occidentalis]|uniref:calcium-binding and spermatid-specific protein 1 isoform X1 n=1 Tax=Talpa occidentalis TaxID=50954 RepID=UPI00188EED21|nr:calcium-binding and spermatid-specific protein 1 isoform X1 [Talpa occidentalis]